MQYDTQHSNTIHSEKHSQHSFKRAFRKFSFMTNFVIVSFNGCFESMQFDAECQMTEQPSAILIGQNNANVNV